MPVIVFHGDMDATVRSDNANGVIDNGPKPTIFPPMARM
jgi:hypothetical protein